MRGMEVGFNFAFGMFGKACFQDLFAFQMQPHRRERLMQVILRQENKIKKGKISVCKSPNETIQHHLICSQNEPMTFFPPANTENRTCSQICQQFNKRLVYNLRVHRRHAFSTYTTTTRSCEKPGVVLSGRKSTASVRAIIRSNSFYEEKT